MAARTKARKRAVDVLYETDLRGSDAVSVVAERVAMADPPVSDYTVELIEGVTSHRRRIDAILSEYSEGWTIARMPDVDRALEMGGTRIFREDDGPGEESDNGRDAVRCIVPGRSRWRPARPR